MCIFLKYFEDETTDFARVFLLPSPLDACLTSGAKGSGKDKCSSYSGHKRIFLLLFTGRTLLRICLLGALLRTRSQPILDNLEGHTKSHCRNPQVM